MNAIHIRRATEDDADAIVCLNREMMELHQQVEPAAYTMTPEADGAYRQHLMRCLPDPDHMIALALCGEEAIGFIRASKVQRPPVLEPPVQGVINAIAVTESARRQGIGGMLVAEAMRWFASQGLTIARASWAINNPLSGPFWVAQGFRPYQVGGVRSVAAENDTNSD
jgi:GNAT superfamily N-acetyltransferase